MTCPNSSFAPVYTKQVSGDGKLSQPAFSGVGLDGLNIYLVSSDSGDNITISEGSGLLTQESGSTVKHLNWPIPSCIAAGNYNVNKLITLIAMSYMKLTLLSSSPFTKAPTSMEK